MRFERTEQEQPSPRSRPSRGLWRTLSGVGLFLLAFGGKLKLLLPLLKLGKVGGTVWSLLLTMGAYAVIYPWGFAVGIVLMILVHEMGHLWAARRRGLPVSAPSFIPFVGALVTMKRNPQDAATEAYIALGGPLVGTLGALVCLYIGRGLDSELLYLIAWFGFFINLLNLLPIHPLDGGRIAAAVSRKLWWIGLVGGLFVVIWLRSILFFLIWAYFAWQMFSSLRAKRKGGEEREMRSVEEVPVRLFSQFGLPVPGQSHRRELEAVSFSGLADRKTYLELRYPGLGVLSRQEFPWGVVTRAELMESHVRGDENEEQVVMKIRLRYLPDERMMPIREEAYYRVSARQRIAFGVAYLGLAAFLGLMMALSGSWVTPL